MDHNPITDRQGETWGRPDGVFWLLVTLAFFFFIFMPALSFHLLRQQCLIDIEGIAPSLRFICLLF
jgi:hypothetical protein